jgi:hypothetical protein
LDCDSVARFGRGCNHYSQGILYHQFASKWLVAHAFCENQLPTVKSHIIDCQWIANIFVAKKAGSFCKTAFCDRNLVEKVWTAVLAVAPDE